MNNFKDFFGDTTLDLVQPEVDPRLDIPKPAVTQSYTIVYVKSYTIVHVVGTRET